MNNSSCVNLEETLNHQNRGPLLTVLVNLNRDNYIFLSPIAQDFFAKVPILLEIIQVKPSSILIFMKNSWLLTARVNQRTRQEIPLGNFVPPTSTTFRPSPFSWKSILQNKLDGKLHDTCELIITHRKSNSRNKDQDRLFYFHCTQITEELPHGITLLHHQLVKNADIKNKF